LKIREKGKMVVKLTDQQYRTARKLRRLVSVNPARDGDDEPYGVKGTRIKALAPIAGRPAITLVVVGATRKRVSRITERQAKAVGVERHDSYRETFARAWDIEAARTGDEPFSARPVVWVTTFRVVLSVD
jgi:hypothetical protein